MNGDSGDSPEKFRVPHGMTDTALAVSYNAWRRSHPEDCVASGATVTGRAGHPSGGVLVSTECWRFGLRVVVGRLATLKADQASIAEAQFSLAA
jgi:hypothetical protein